MRKCQRSCYEVPPSLEFLPELLFYLFGFLHIPQPRVSKTEQRFAAETASAAVEGFGSLKSVVHSSHKCLGWSGPVSLYCQSYVYYH